MPLASCTKHTYPAFWCLGLRAHGDIFIQLAPDKLLQKLNRSWLEATWVVQCLGMEKCLSQGTSMLVQPNCLQIATAVYAASSGCTQSLLAPACVDISAVFKSSYRTASSGRVKINYQITAKRNSGTVTESVKSGKRMLLEREKNFCTKIFPSACQSIQNWKLAGTSSTLQFSVGCLVESSFGSGWARRLEILLCVLRILDWRPS